MLVARVGAVDPCSPHALAVAVVSLVVETDVDFGRDVCAFFRGSDRVFACGCCRG